MQIIMGKEAADKIGEKYIVLKLDTFKVESNLVPAFAVLDAGSIPLGEMQEIPTCQGRWGGSMDSFYTEMLDRIKILKMKKPPKDWDGVIIK